VRAGKTGISRRFRPTCYATRARRRNNGSTGGEDGRWMSWGRTRRDVPRWNDRTSAASGTATDGVDGVLVRSEVVALVWVDVDGEEGTAYCVSWSRLSCVVSGHRRDEGKNHEGLLG